MIKHLSHTEIDKAKWDDCLAASIRPLLYALSWWLDIVSPGWEALVKGDYEVVMPLPQKKKYFINYLIQPYLSQQLGIFSCNPLTTEEIDLILGHIPKKYHLVHLHLNTPHIIDNKLFDTKLRHSHVLDLSSSYETISGNYHRSCRGNIINAQKTGLRVAEAHEPQAFSIFVRKHLHKKFAGIKEHFYSNLLQLTEKTLENKTGEILSVYLEDELQATAWIVTNTGRCLFMLCASSPEGKKHSSMYFLMDQIIRKKSGSDLILDFTGSELPGVAFFNKGFGAVEEDYQVIYRNTLLWPLNKIKK